MAHWGDVTAYFVPVVFGVFQASAAKLLGSNPAAD